MLACDRVEAALDGGGRVITRWDGKTFKPSPVTGEPVPDEAARVAQWAYVNPRRAEWPQADFIVGNPPFIGNKRMRDALGDGYVQALRGAWPEVPGSADFVMFWWHNAAAKVAAGQARSCGLITTNSITQAFNRSVIEAALGKGLRLGMAIADHPWVDGATGAQVRVAMSTVDRNTDEPGTVLRLAGETVADDGAFDVALAPRVGLIAADLSVGANMAALQSLLANKGLACPGVQLSGQGFVLSPTEAASLRAGSSAALIKRYLTGRDLTQTMREQYVIDTLGLTSDELLSQHPDAFQRLLDRVKPERDHNPREFYRVNWWRHAEPRGKFRAALSGLRRFAVSSRTARHRTFQFIGADALPETKVLILAFDDAFALGVLQSETHVCFANRVGGWLGVGNDSTYNHSECFEKFPFPAEDTGLTPELSDRIRALAEQIDAHRKARQAAHEAVTLTGLYNVLAKLRSGEPLSTKDKQLHEQGLVSVLRTLHDELDTAVLQAYGWADLGAVPWGDETARAAWTETLLERLVALNARRAAEEAQGLVRWLRPEFQDPARRHAATVATPAQAELDVLTEQPTQPDDSDDGSAEAPSATPGISATSTATSTATRRPWPPSLPEQMRAVADTLATSPGPLGEAALADRFTGRGPWKKRLPQILQTLEALGRARADAGASGAVWRAA